MSSLLVVAGEASGDRAGAAVVARLEGVRAFGMGGGALAGEGVELVADLRDVTAMGIAEVAHRALRVALAYSRVRAAIARRKPAAALLVNYTEFNARLAPVLWQHGTRVLWYGAPQIWAWRSSRATPLRRSLDRMAVMLPFEEQLWRDLGVDAHYVGHPALEAFNVRGSAPDTPAPDTALARSAWGASRPLSRPLLGPLAEATRGGGTPDVEATRGGGTPDVEKSVTRVRLGMTPLAPAVAILPGSRPHEVRRLLEPMLAGFEEVRRDRASVDARLLLAASLDDATRAWARGLARALEIDTVPVDPRIGIGPLLPAFDVALCASGTASLECALARVIPVVCYRVGWAAEAAARALLETPHVALPNVLLGRPAFPELLQRNAHATRIADELARVLDERPSFLASCNELEEILGDDKSPSREVARMLEPWLARPESQRSA
ncbi:MAG: hypothetical protein KIT84_21995 [Labilithrix sp.]|nr:hypothetical protein [Labilithrix sp.]MCW5813717.1 hypothetical protein [Labilithrix sp.]